MSSICFYFQVHQPYRIDKFRHTDIGSGRKYFSDQGETDLNNAKVLRKVALKCYLPANQTFLSLLKRHPELRLSYSFSGVFLQQLQEYAPEVLDSFKALVDTGQVEVLSETYYHSLSFLHSKKEFIRQIDQHRILIKKLFNVEPTVYRNTELIYSNEVAEIISQLGYKAMLMEGADHVLGWRSPNYIYHAYNNPDLKLLLKNYRLSDDIAFRFSNRDWVDFPLTAEKFAHWVGQVNGNGEIVNLFMDYETFGEHQWEDTGIFQFLESLPTELLKHPDNNFVTPSEAVEKFSAYAELDIPYYVSWADVDRDLSAWQENAMQQDALRALFELEELVYATKDSTLIEDWKMMTTSDHFYYMCTKWFADGDVHAYFNPYDTPYDAYRYFMNALTDLRLRVQTKTAHAKIPRSR